MILIISDPVDGHVRLVAQRLREKGARVELFDVAEVPGQAALSARVADGEPLSIRARRADGDLDLDGVETVWIRRIGHGVKADPGLSEEDADFARSETTSFLYSLADVLRDRFCVNPIREALATDRGNGKVSQLEVARRHDLSIPRTLVSNDPDAVRSFVRSCRGGAIYKPFLSASRVEETLGGGERWLMTFTTKITEQHLAKLDEVSLAPCIFQELVSKRLELRVTVIGAKVFATEIHSQGDARSAVDFRAHYALGETPYAVHALPAKVRDRLLAVHHELGLVFGAYDLILTPDGRYVFLEVNQQGQFLWLEEQTGQPLLENFCEMLIQGRASYRCTAKDHAPGLPPLAEPELRKDRRPPLARRASKGKREREKGKSRNNNREIERKRKGKGNKR